MEKLTKERLVKTISTIKSFKEMILEKGSKEVTVSYIIGETGLTKEECELAYDFYNDIQLPEADIEKLIKSFS